MLERWLRNVCRNCESRIGPAINRIYWHASLVSLLVACTLPCSSIFPFTEGMKKQRLVSLPILPYSTSTGLEEGIWQQGLVLNWALSLLMLFGSPSLRISEPFEILFRTWQGTISEWVACLITLWPFKFPRSPHISSCCLLRNGFMSSEWSSEFLRTLMTSKRQSAPVSYALTPASQDELSDDEVFTARDPAGLILLCTSCNLRPTPVKPVLVFLVSEAAQASTHSTDEAFVWTWASDGPAFYTCSWFHICVIISHDSLIHAWHCVSNTILLPWCCLEKEIIERVSSHSYALNWLQYAQVTKYHKHKTVQGRKAGHLDNWCSQILRITYLIYHSEIQYIYI